MSNFRSAEVETQIHQVQTSTPKKITTDKVGNKVNKDIQCDLDADLPSNKVTWSDSSSHRTDKAVDASTDTENLKATDVITHTDLYQLLAVLMQMSEDRSISRSTMIKAVLTHVFDIIDRPHDDIKQAIRQYYSPPSAGLTDSTKSITQGKDHENRATTLCSKPVSEPKGSFKHTNTK